MPKVSIIMPVYNAAHYLRIAIDSVLKQTLSDFELIIINDGSTDDSDKIINTYLEIDDRIKYLSQEKNNGLIYSLNLGLNNAKGEYIARLDGDDFWIDEDKLSKQLKFLNDNQEYGLVGTGAKIVDLTGKKISIINNPSSDHEIKNIMLLKNCFIHSSVMFRKKAVIENGLYLSEEKFVEDYGLWARIGRSYKLFNFSDIMVGYRINPGGETINNNLVQIENSLRVALKNKKYYPNFLLGLFKWYIKYALVFTFGTRMFISLKTFFSKKT